MGAAYVITRMHLFSAHFLSFFLAPIMLFGSMFTHTPLIPPVSTTTEPVACTMEAKLCPDGSYVGRQGPRCEFAACPTPATSTPSDPHGPAASTTALSITSISPRTGAVGTQMMIKGNFSAGDYIVHFGSGAIGPVRATSFAIPCASSGNCGGLQHVIVFAVPESVGPYCKPGMMCPMYQQLVTPGTYKVSVSSDDDVSNIVSFTVTAAALE